MAYLPSLALSSATLPLEKSLSYQQNPPRIGINSEAKPRPLGFDEAFERLKDGTQFDSTTYVPLLAHCIETNSLSNAKSLHAHILKTGSNNDLYLTTYLVNTFMKCGAPEYALKVFDKITERNNTTWTVLISGYVRNSDPENALKMFIHLLESGYYPIFFTFWAVLTACCDLYNLRLGEQVHAYIIKLGFSSKEEVAGPLSSMYLKCGNMESAVKAFEGMSKRDVISWTSIISSCGDTDEPVLGLKVFIAMLHEEVWPNEVTLSSVSMLLCAIENLQLGLTRQFHSFCIKHGEDSISYVRNSLINMYLKCGEIEEALKLLENMEKVNLVTINAVIAGLNKMICSINNQLVVHSNGLKALKIFRNLTRSLIKPDMYTFSSIVTICANILALQQGTQIHAQMVKTGVLSDLVSSGSLLSMYGKCGRVDDASKVFNEMPDRNAFVCTSMISSYSQNGRHKEAIDLFEEMLSKNQTPNSISFIGVLSACSFARLIDKAEYYFEMMKNKYGLRPKIGHYACMVDLLCRLGRVEEAFEFIKTENFEPNEIIWSMLLASSRRHGNMDLAFYAAEKLEKLKPEADSYVLLLNIYKSANRWQDFARVKNLMKQNKLPTIRDRSWITIKGKIRYFRSNDKANPKRIEIYQMLENLTEKAKELGYVPYFESNESEDGEDEEKGKSRFVVHHSEKLAVSFGLISESNNGVPISVSKKIPMCYDCHSFFKLVSVMTEREIVVKDSRRLHKFKDGQCLCGDYEALT